MSYRILEGDVMEKLRELPDASVDSIVTDPPYGLEFMGKDWDAPWKTDRRQLFDGTLKESKNNPYSRSRVRSGNGSGYGADQHVMQMLQDWHFGWAIEALRVLKPGGHLLAFGGSRTYHRMACAIEDAGFEIRDQIMWLYGSGFPKSLDVSKAIDKAARGVPQGGPDPTSANHGMFKGGCSEENPTGRGFGAGPGQFMKGREVIGTKLGRPGYSLAIDKGRSVYSAQGRSSEVECAITAPATEAAKRWQGWGTALKPAHEPIVVARKPILGTVAANVLAYGTGGINIDACRVAGDVPTCTQGQSVNAGTIYGADQRDQRDFIPSELGRWPANVIHDGSEEVLDAFPDAPGALSPVLGTEPSSVQKNVFGERTRVAGPPVRSRKGEPAAEKRYTAEGSTSFAMTPGPRWTDMGTAARFFYCAKADKEEREIGCHALDAQPLAYGNQAQAEVKRGITEKPHKDGMNAVKMRGNHHPTVKPVDLMAYLCRLVTPPQGMILDLFMGSGTTGIAALREGFHFIGIEINPAYVEIARRRIEADAPLFNKESEEAKEL